MPHAMDPSSQPFRICYLGKTPFVQELGSGTDIIIMSGITSFISSRIALDLLAIARWPKFCYPRLSFLERVFYIGRSYASSVRENLISGIIQSPPGFSRLRLIVATFCAPSLVVTPLPPIA